MSKDQEIDLSALSAAIAERLHRSDDQVLEEILDRFGGFVRGKLASRFGAVLDDLDLDDVLSRALFRLWRYRERYDPKRASLSTWFYLLGRSEALDLLRKRAGQQEMETELAAAKEEQVPARSDADETPMPVSGGPSRLAQLRTLLQKLPDIDRRILLAFADVEGQGHWAETLAGELGMPAATIRSRKFRALAHLRGQLAEQGPAMLTGGPTMSIASPELLNDRAAEIEHIAEGLRRYFLKVREPFLKGDGLANFQATWTAAVKDGSIKESSRRNILTQTYRWLRGRASKQDQYHDQLREFFDRSLKRQDVPSFTMTRTSQEEGIRRLELALAGISTEIERPMPDNAIRKGEGRVYLRWEKDRRDATITWEGGTDAVRLRGAAVHSFAANARLPDPEVTYFSDRVVEEVAEHHRLAPPNFSYPPDLKSGQLPATLDWRPSQVEPVPEKQMPGWIKSLAVAPEALPTPAEQDFHKSLPNIAERLDKMLCEAALNDYRALKKREAVHAAEEQSLEDYLALKKQEAPRAAKEQPPHSVSQLIEEIARRAGRSWEEIAELAGQGLLGRQRQASAEEGAANTIALTFLWSQLNAP